MGVFWRHFGAGRDASGDARRRRHKPEVQALEDRRVPAVLAVTAVVHPRLLLPRHGQTYVQVTVTGTVQQAFVTTLPNNPTTAPPPAVLAGIEGAMAAKPAPTKVIGLVTDSYRIVNPHVTTTVGRMIDSQTYFKPSTKTSPTAQVGLTRDFAYKFTVTLQATSHSQGRQYDITVAAEDGDALSQTTVFAFVPKDVS
jgi:hypothetical protein